MSADNSSQFICYQRASQDISIALASTAALINLIFIGSAVKQRDVIKRKSVNAYIIYLLVIAFIFSFTSVVHAVLHRSAKGQIPLLSSNDSDFHVELSAELVSSASFFATFRASLLVTSSFGNCLFMFGVRTSSSVARTRGLTFHGTEHCDRRSKFFVAIYQIFRREKLFVATVVVISWVPPMSLAILSACGWRCNDFDCISKVKGNGDDLSCSLAWFPMTMDFVVVISCLWFAGFTSSFVTFLSTLRKMNNEPLRSRAIRSGRMPCISIPSVKGSVLTCGLSYFTSILLIVTALANDSKFSGIPLDVFNALHCGFQSVQPILLLLYFDDIKTALRRSTWNKVYIERPPVTKQSVSTEPKANAGFELMVMSHQSNLTPHQEKEAEEPFLSHETT